MDNNDPDDLKGLFEPTGDSFFTNFAIMIPHGPFTMPPPPPKPFLCRIGIHKWGFAGISFFGPGHPRICERCHKVKWFNKPLVAERLGRFVGKWSDRTFRPLCMIGWHHWKRGYAMYIYMLGGPDQATKSVNHTCTRCGKHKLVEEA